jgi:monoterpene epsilon-lactone hydrolase
MSTRREFLKYAAVSGTLAVSVRSAQAKEPSGRLSKVTVDADGTTHVPAYDVPLSIYMSEGAKRAYIAHGRSALRVGSTRDIVEVRKNLDRLLHIPLLERAKAAYSADVAERETGGIPTLVVTPKEGVAERNRNRVLINLHAGGLMVGAGPVQLIESLPIASTAKINVVSVNYRLAPEHKFPAPLQDLTAVYKELLKQYRPQDIGIYGQSLGGALSLMSAAWFQKEKMPRPGAIGAFSAPGFISGGDSRYTAPPLSALTGGNSPPPPALPNPPESPVPHGYLDGWNPEGSLVSPMLHRQVLAQFPPTLLITGTRDTYASDVINSHRQLVRAGVTADLQIWDAMWHGFILDVDIPESREMYEVTARFFDAHLGQT